MLKILTFPKQKFCLHKLTKLSPLQVIDMSCLTFGFLRQCRAMNKEGLSCSIWYTYHATKYSTAQLCMYLYM